MSTTIPRSLDEIIEQIDRSYDQEYEGMTYSEGVRHALDWITGDADEPPFEDETIEDDEDLDLEDDEEGE